MTSTLWIRTICACLLASLFPISLAFSFELITAEEAMRPDDKRDYVTRGVVPLPKIKIHNPEGRTTSPFNLVIEIKPFGGAEINRNSLKVRYLKEPHVDLRPRIETFLKTKGKTIVINIPDAKAPPGKHRILFQVEDSNDQLGQGELNFEVVQSK